MNPEITEIFNAIFKDFAKENDTLYRNWLKIHEEEDEKEVDENSELHDLLYNQLEEEFKEFGWELFVELMANNIESLKE